MSRTKKALHEVGESLSIRMVELIDAESDSTQSERISSALVHVLMHLSDCARYKEKHDQAIKFAELIRVLKPGDPESHMRLGLSLPLTSSHMDAPVTLKAFYHLCVFLANRGVPLNSPEAKIVHIAAQNASAREHVLSRKPSPPEPAILFVLRFISACWSVLTDNITQARKSALSTRLWLSASEFLAVKEVKGTESTKHRQVTEDMLLYTVGIAIFVRHRTSRKGISDASFCDKRAIAADALLRKLLVALCESGISDLQRLNALVKNGKKSRRRAMRKKRRHNGQSIADSLSDELGASVFSENASVEHLPASLGALAILSHFWSKVFENVIIPQQERPVAEALRALNSVIRELDQFQEISGTTPYCARVRSTIVSLPLAEVPSLKEDILLGSFKPCRERELFKIVVLHSVRPKRFFAEKDRGADYGQKILSAIDHALDKLGSSRYEEMVSLAAQRHLNAYGQRMQRLLYKQGSPFLMKPMACSVLTTFAIRQPRIERMKHKLSAYAGGRLANMILSTPPGATQSPLFRDVLSTHSSEGSFGNDESDPPQPAQQPCTYVRSSSSDNDSITWARNVAKRRRQMCPTIEQSSQ